jgi:cysteine desulfurase/selenocysteine lyase
MNIRDHIEEIRAQFPILERTMNGKPLDYLDNSATTLKPQCVIDEVVRYYTYLGANAHRGDYEMSAQVDFAYEGARKTTAKFINAESDKEIVFTSGTTESLNILALMITNQILKEGDVILSMETEHASSILPWQQAGAAKKVAVEFIELTEEGRLTVENFKKALDDHPNTRVVMIAQVSNVLGYQSPVKEICRIAHERDIIVCIDGAQSVAHIPVDVQDLDCDFFAFSGHKICGPTGIGVLYGKKHWLETLRPVIYGGESNARYYKDYESLVLRRSPMKYESGTQPIEGALGMAAAMRYLKKLDLNDIHAYECELKQYFLKQAEEKLKDKIKVYNAGSEGGIITFNAFDQGKLIFPQDLASYLSSQGIAVRSGQHCAKLMGDLIKAPGTVRASIYFYNTYEDIDRLVKALEEATIEKCLDIFI